jgi:cytochrome c5
MKHLPTFSKTLCLAMAATVVIAASSLISAVRADDAKPTATKPSVTKKLTGAELYAINCNRCHQERYPTEFTSAQWQTIMTHMRVRANLPAQQVKAIVKYMKEEAGN